MSPGAELGLGPDVGATDLIDTLAVPPARILIVGSGVGLLASALTEAGFRAVGTDTDPGMLGIARDRDARTPWLDSRPGRLALAGRAFAVVLAGRRAFGDLGAATLRETVEAFAAHLPAGGHLIAELDSRVVGIADAPDPTAYDRACEAADLAYTARYAGWRQDRFVPGSPIAIAVHRRR